MDPISLILTALSTAAGAAAVQGAAQGLTLGLPQSSAQEAFNGLKDLIKRKFDSQGQSGANYVLQQHEKKPELAEELLKEALIEVEADKDREIIAAAQKLLQQLKPEESAAGKYNLKGKDSQGVVGETKIENSQGFFGNNQGTVTLTFNLNLNSNYRVPWTNEVHLYNSL